MDLTLGCYHFKMFRLVAISCLLALSLGASLPKAKKPLRNLRPIFPSGRIVGGVETPIEDVPYQVALELDRFQFCGGSIIGPRHILCAGHCIEGFEANEITVRTGTSKHQTGGTLVQAKALNGHPKYDSFAIDYDVSVIELEQDIEFGSGSQPITPTDEEPAAGTDVLVSGWGTLQEGGNTADTLYSVTVPVVDRATCEKAYNDLNPITARMICAGVAGKDSCQGDSGGPVVAGSGENARQVGIVSWGLGCAEDGYPGVYTNVADKDIRSFIKEQAGV